MRKNKFLEVPLIIENICFLNASKTESHKLHFTHQYFRDYFAAKHILNLSEAIEISYGKNNPDEKREFLTSIIWEMYGSGMMTTKSTALSVKYAVITRIFLLTMTLFTARLFLTLFLIWAVNFILFVQLKMSYEPCRSFVTILFAELISMKLHCLWVFLIV